MSILQLDPVIPVITPKGSGIAWLVIDYGAEHNLMFVVAIDETGEIWTFSNQEIRAQKNITMGRTFEKKAVQQERKDQYVDIGNNADIRDHVFPGVTLPYK